MRKRRVVAIVSIAALFLTGVSVVWLAPQGWVRKTLVRRFESATGLRVEARDVVTDWHGARMSFTSGSIAVFGADGNRIFDARALHCIIDARRLLLGKIAVDDIVVDEPHIALTVVNGGLVGVPLPKEHTTHASLVRIDIDRVRAHHGVVEVTLPPRHDGLADEGVVYRPAMVRLSDLDVVAAPDGADEHRVHVTARGVDVLRGGEVVLRGPPLAFDVWAGGDSLLAIDRVTLPDVAIHSPSLDVDADGVVNLPITGHRRVPSVDVALIGETTLTGAGPLADLQQRFAGDFTVSGRAISVMSGALDVDADIAVHDLFVNKMLLGNVDGHMHTDDAEAQVTSASWEIGATTIRGQAHGQLAGELPFHVDATGDRFSLYRLFRDLHFSRAPWVEALVSGKASADGALVPFVLAGHGSGVASDVAVASKDAHRATHRERVLDVAERLRVDVDFHADQTSLRFPRGSIDDGTTRVHGAVELFVNKARGFVVDIASPALSLASVRDHIGPVAMTATASGVLHAAGPYAHPRVNASVQAHDLVVERYALGDGDGKIAATPTTLALADVVLHKGRSQYRGGLTLDFAKAHGTGTSGSADVVGKPPHLLLDIKLDDARAEDLRSIIPRPSRDPVLAALRDIALDGPIAGDVHAEGFVGGHTTRSLDADGTLAADRGATLYGVDVDGRKLSLHMHRGHIEVGGIR